jgi:hypothetical protein
LELGPGRHSALVPCTGGAKPELRVQRTILEPLQAHKVFLAVRVDNIERKVGQQAQRDRSLSRPTGCAPVVGAGYGPLTNVCILQEA